MEFLENGYINSNIYNIEFEEGFSNGYKKGWLEGYSNAWLKIKKDSIIEILKDKGEINTKLSKILRGQNDIYILKEWYRISLKVNTIEEFESYIIS